MGAKVGAEGPVGTRGSGGAFQPQPFCAAAAGGDVPGSLFFED